MVMRIVKDIALIWVAVLAFGVGAIALLALYYRVADFFRHLGSNGPGDSVLQRLRGSARTER